MSSAHQLTTTQLNRVYDGFYKQVERIDLLATDASGVATYALTDDGDFVGRLIGEGKGRLPQTSHELMAAIRKVQKVTLGTLRETIERDRVATLSVTQKREAREHVLSAFQETLKLAQRTASVRGKRQTSPAAIAVTLG